MQYLAQQGFRGRVYPVNPRAERIQGLQAYPSLDALPEVPDAVILCVGSDAVEAQLSLCASLGVRAVVLFASGYAEVGALGLAEQQKLVDICRRGGMRLLGPNSIGVASFDTGAVLSFASIYADCVPLDGPVAIVSQSGAFGVSVYALLREAGIGVRSSPPPATKPISTRPTSCGTGAAAGRAPDPALPRERRRRRAHACGAADGTAAWRVRGGGAAGRSADGCRSAGLHTGSAGAANDALDALFADSGCRTVADMGEMLRCVPGYLRAGGRAARGLVRRRGSRSSATRARPASSRPTKPAAPASRWRSCPRPARRG